MSAPLSDQATQPRAWEFAPPATGSPAGRWSLRTMLGLLIWCAVGFAICRAIGLDRLGFALLVFSWLTAFVFQAFRRSWRGLLLQLSPLLPLLACLPILSRLANGGQMNWALGYVTLLLFGSLMLSLIAFGDEYARGGRASR